MVAKSRWCVQIRAQVKAKRMRMEHESQAQAEDYAQKKRLTSSEGFTTGVDRTSGFLNNFTEGQLSHGRAMQEAGFE
jgi:hypothetical protein